MTLRLIRHEGRLLRPLYSSEGPRGVHNKLGRKIVTAMRSTYGVEPVSLHVSEVHGCVREQATGSRGDYSPRPDPNTEIEWLQIVTFLYPNTENRMVTKSKHCDYHVILQEINMRLDLV